MSEDLVRLVEKIAGDAPVAFDKIEYSKSKGLYTLYFHADKPISMRIIMGLRRRLNLNFKSVGKQI